MRLPVLPVIILLCTGILVDYAICRRLSKPAHKKALRIAYIAVSAVVTAAMVIVALWPKKGASEHNFGILMWSMFTYLSVYIPKYFFAIACLIQKIFSKLLRRACRGIAIGGAGVAIITFVAMWWGALFTRFNIDVRDVDIEIENLPEAFCGYRIVQISDIHTGTYLGNPHFLQKVVEKINALQPDIILFTGDIVNRHSDELIPFIPTLSALHAPDGVWSIMGNHDYGEYYRWPSESDRLADVERLKKMQGNMGWNMLNNSHTVLRRGNDSIVVVGVENIGDPPFTTYGNLRKAYPSLSDSTTKILMTHNPAHWTDSIADHPDVNVALTLSGHTHAMQIRILGWSPADLRYRTWGGLYADSLDHKLYVNIGIGEVGFPSRIGATPEITLITLKKQ